MMLKHAHIRRRSCVLIAVLPVLLAGAFIAGLTGTKSEVVPEMVLLYAENQSDDYPTTLGGQYFAELVEEKTGGRIRILVCPDSELGTESEVIEQLQFGGVDFARVSLGLLSEYVPQMNILQMPYLYRDSAHMWEVLNGEIGRELLEKLPEYDLVGLSWYDAGARNFYSSEKPITCLEDLRGMRIRIQYSDMMAELVEELGATPLRMDYYDVYSALEQKLVDAAENNLPSYESMLHYEVAGYYTLDEHTRVPEVQICSMKTWNRLSEADREIIASCAAESSVYEQKLWTEREEAARKLVEESGVQTIELSDEEKQKFREAVREIYQEFCGEDMDLIRVIIETGQSGLQDGRSEESDPHNH